MAWITLLCLALVLGLLSWGAGRLVYYPMKYPGGDWELREMLRAEDVSLRTSDGTNLNAWWIAPPNAKFATLHLHGNAGNITHRGLVAEAVVQGGSAVLLLDYRGYGRSEGSPGERGLHHDAEAGYEFLVSRGFQTRQIVLHGESLGTAVATWLASHRPCAGVVLEAPFTSAAAVAGSVVPILGPLLIHGYDSLQTIGQVRAPVLVIHGDHDEVVRYAFGREVFQAANEPKKLWTVVGAGHNDLHVVARREFPQRLAAFYASLGR